MNLEQALGSRGSGALFSHKLKSAKRKAGLYFSAACSHVLRSKHLIRPASRLLHFKRPAKAFILASSFSHLPGEKRRVLPANRNLCQSKGGRAFGELGAIFKRSPRAVEPRNVRVALQSNYAFKRTAGTFHRVSWRHIGPRPLNAPLGRMFKVVAILIYLSSIVAVLVTGGLVSSVLALYPVSHIGSFGPMVPAISQTHAAWLPAVPMVTWVIVAASLLAGGLLWRSRRAAGAKLQAALLIGAVNYALALFFTTTLLVAYFYLPKVANAA